MNTSTGHKNMLETTMEMINKRKIIATSKQVQTSNFFVIKSTLSGVHWHSSSIVLNKISAFKIKSHIVW